ncbi:MAG: hypothetical protein ACN6O8_25880 [Achromobacter sp.]|uniref:hypothetical protein n=1 Tax=Achromobacter sp. TaxID=134375 RepID=UPI003CFDDFDB
MTELASIPYPLSWTDPQGRVWHAYSIEFSSPDGTYACHIYAISDEHAQLQLDALKETGRITGQTIGAFDA